MKKTYKHIDYTGKVTTYPQDEKKYKTYKDVARRAARARQTARLVKMFNK
jgi:hypothetical protein